MIRAMTVEDLPAARALLGEVGLGGAIANIARYLRWQPDGVWVAVEGGEVVGTVALLDQGAAAFVGAMAVAPARQGTGVGRRLLEHAHARGRAAGVTTFLLEATPRGAPLYRALGYVAEHETIVATKVAAAPVGMAPFDGALDEVVTLDAVATGAARCAMVRALIAEGGPAVVVPGRDRDGGPRGYGLRVDDRLGPVIALDGDAGRALVAALAPACAVVSVPAPNEAAVAAVVAHGFVEARRLTRMRLGPPVGVRPTWVWALANPGTG
jgi:N-acetylglutamate synthase-like GNAT family acetyltransferase